VARRTVAALLIVAAPLGAQTAIDSTLSSYIAGIKAVDNHAHPLLPTVPGARPDTDFDALPLGTIPPFPLPARLEPDNPAWIDAWRALDGYTYTDASPLHVDALMRLKEEMARARRDRAPAMALDQMGTEVMLANRVAMGPGLGPPRFRWVPFVDPLLFPLNVAKEAEGSPDYRTLYPHEAGLLRRYLRDLPLSALPSTLDAYIARVVVPTIEHDKAAGAIAIKFEVAYLRPLDFGNPTLEAARAVYARYVHGGAPPHADYRLLEDYLFRAIGRTAGRLGLPVHIHCMDLAGGYYHVAGANPLLLEDVFNDSTLRKTNFVLLHGGWPFTRQTLSMLAKPNVYTDISLMTDVLSPYTLAGVLREWLTEYPDKVLYGSDAFADRNDVPVGWAEVGWLSARSGRRALAIALTAMMQDGDITRERAQQIALMVLRNNARRLYGPDLTG
jgi:uncharacterized protein